MDHDMGHDTPDRGGREPFRLLAEASRDVVLLSRPGRVEWVSPSVEELLGHTPEEILAMDPTSLVHPEDLPRVVELRTVLSREGIDEGRARIRHRNGDWRWFESRARLVPDDDGRVTDRFLSTWRDIDEQVRLEQALQQGERRFRLLLESASDHVAVLHGPDVPRRLEWVTSRGEGVEDVAIDDPVELVHPDDRAAARRWLQEVQRSGAPAERVRLRVLDGGRGYRWMAVVARYLGDDPVTGGVLVALHDVDEEVRAHRALVESERRYRLLVENATDGVAHVRDGRFVWVSPTVEQLSGWRPEQLVGRSVAEYLHPDDLDGLADLQARRRDEPDALMVAQLRLRNAGGTHNWVEVRVRPFVDEDGRADGNAVSLRLVDGEVAARQALERRARYDEVTGLMNRTEVLERLTGLPRGPRRSGTEVAVLFCDVDGLKVVNDTYGHRAGDMVLRSVADRVVAGVRADDLVARIGGDELLVVLNGVHDLAQAVEVAEKLRASVARPLAVDGAALVPSLSIGVALARPGDGPEELVARADAAMYAAKTAGRDRVASVTDHGA